MAFTKLTGTGHTANGVDYVSKLDNKPNDVGGLTPAQLKAIFDQAGMEIQAYLNNTLTAELEAQGAAGKIGVQDIGELDIGAGKNIQAALVALYQAIQDATAGVLLDGSVTDAKLALNAVTSTKIAEGAVNKRAIGTNAVGDDELDTDAVIETKIKNGNVTHNKLSTGAVWEGNISDKAVSLAKIKDDFVLPISKGGIGVGIVGDENDETNKATARSNIGAQKAIQSSSFSLTVAGWNARSGGGWTQTATMNNSKLDSAFVASPSDETSWKRAQDANLFPPTVLTDGQMTFTCDEQPAGAITVTVYFW
jgi:hypothetical protein